MAYFLYIYICSWNPGRTMNIFNTMAILNPIYSILHLFNCIRFYVTSWRIIGRSNFDSACIIQ